MPAQEFIPQQQLEPQHSAQTTLNPYHDPFLSQQDLTQAINAFDSPQQQVNPYAHTAQPVGGQTFYQDNSSYKHPLQYHLYASIGPKRDNLLPYQRASSDFFIPDDLREDLQRKSEAALLTYASSQTVAHYHSLALLDTHDLKGPHFFGYPSSVYKAVSSKDGHTYALRRLEGFKLDPNNPITSTVNSWKRVSNASFVRFHEAFTDTNRFLSGYSLFVVTDYHPKSQTLAEKHFAATARPTRSTHSNAQSVPENELWGYIVQLASALKSIHEAGLAAQTVKASKILVTSKNRVRLNGCGVLDIARYEQQRPVAELQRADLEDLGKLILSLAVRNSSAQHSAEKSLQLLNRSPYTERLKSCVLWLLSPPTHLPDQPQPSGDYTINALLTNISDKLVSVLDSTLHLEDDLTTHLLRELENGRLVRLLAKLNIILERPDPNPTTNPQNLSASWSETGERYYLKLFRDYVFHQVDAEGHAVLDLGHVVSCLNKLDAGVEERVVLVSRDEQSVFVVSYREVKRGVEGAWAEVGKVGGQGGRGR